MSSLQILSTAGGRPEYALFGQPGGSGNSAALLNGCILLDTGPTVFRALEMIHAEKAVKEILITHSHWDHFNVEVVNKLVRLNPEICVSANAVVLSQLDGSIRTRELKPGISFESCSCRFTALPANHAIVDHPEETPLHYLCETPGGNCLYALDGAWMTTLAKRIIEKCKLQLIVWDATCGSDDDWRMFEHNTPAMLIQMREALQKMGVTDSNTRHLLSHLARAQLWTKEAEQRITSRGFEIAFDGMNVSF